jgi:hypothetical protein
MRMRRSSRRGRGELEAQVLQHLMAHPAGFTTTELCHLCRRSTQDIAPLLRRLEAHGQVQRMLAHVPGRNPTLLRWQMVREDAAPAAQGEACA